MSTTLINYLSSLKFDCSNTEEMTRFHTLSNKLIKASSCYHCDGVPQSPEYIYYIDTDDIKKILEYEHLRNDINSIKKFNDFLETYVKKAHDVHENEFTTLLECPHEKCTSLPLIIKPDNYGKWQSDYCFSFLQNHKAHQYWYMFEYVHEDKRKNTFDNHFVTHVSKLELI